MIHPTPSFPFHPLQISLFSVTLLLSDFHSGVHHAHGYEEQWRVDRGWRLLRLSPPLLWGAVGTRVLEIADLHILRR